MPFASETFTCLSRHSPRGHFHSSFLLLLCCVYQTNRNVFNPMTTCVVSCGSVLVTFVQTRSQRRKNIDAFLLIMMRQLQLGTCSPSITFKQVKRVFICVFVAPHPIRIATHPISSRERTTRAQFPLDNNILGWCKDDANLSQIIIIISEIAHTDITTRVD